jgi:hypothetical protein
MNIYTDKSDTDELPRQPPDMTYLVSKQEIMPTVVLPEKSNELSATENISSHPNYNNLKSDYYDYDNPIQNKKSPIFERNISSKVVHYTYQALDENMGNVKIMDDPTPIVKKSYDEVRLRSLENVEENYSSSIGSSKIGSPHLLKKSNPGSNDHLERKVKIRKSEVYDSNRNFVNLNYNPTVYPMEPNNTSHILDNRIKEALHHRLESSIDSQVQNVSELVNQKNIDEMRSLFPLINEKIIRVVLKKSKNLEYAIDTLLSINGFDKGAIPMDDMQKTNKGPMDIKLCQLKEMLPRCSEASLKEALEKNNCDVQSAADYILEAPNQGRKEHREIWDHRDNREVYNKQREQVREVREDHNDGKLYTNVMTLKQLFPHKSESDIKMALSKNDNNIQDAADVLLKDMKPKKNEERSLRNRPNTPLASYNDPRNLNPIDSRNSYKRLLKIDDGHIGIVQAPSDLATSRKITEENKYNEGLNKNVLDLRHVLVYDAIVIAEEELGRWSKREVEVGNITR